MRPCPIKRCFYASNEIEAYKSTPPHCLICPHNALVSQLVPGFLACFCIDASLKRMEAVTPSHERWRATLEIMKCLSTVFTWGIGGLYPSPFLGWGGGFPYSQVSWSLVFFPSNTRQKRNFKERGNIFIHTEKEFPPSGNYFSYFC